MREVFEEVNDFIASVKKIFKKAPLTSLWKQTSSNHPLTRWGIWIRSASFYSEHFDAMKGVADMLDPGGGATIKRGQQLMIYNQLKTDLAFIDANFFFSLMIMKLRSRAFLSVGLSRSCIE